MTKVLIEENVGQSSLVLLIFFRQMYGPKQGKERGGGVVVLISGFFITPITSQVVLVLVTTLFTLYRLTFFPLCSSLHLPKSKQRAKARPFCKQLHQLFPLRCFKVKNIQV